MRMVLAALVENGKMVNGGSEGFTKERECGVVLNFCLVQSVRFRTHLL